MVVCVQVQGCSLNSSLTLPWTMSNDLDINELKVPAGTVSSGHRDHLWRIAGQGCPLAPDAAVHAERAARALYVYILDAMRQGLWEGMCEG